MLEIKDAAKYLDENIRTIIENEVLDIADFFSRPDRNKQAGYFTVPKLVLTLTEFLGFIAFGNGKESKAIDGVNFLKECFGYERYPNLIFEMWRHGTVHRCSPDIFELNIDDKYVTVGWMANNDRGQGNQSANVEAFEFIDKPNTVVVNINIYKLAKDLLSALDNLIEKINRNEVSNADCCRRLNLAIGPRSPKSSVVDEIKVLFELYERGELKKINKYGQPPE